MKFEIYKDGAKEWRWRLLAANGRIVATSGEGYKRKKSCVRAAVRLPYNLVEKGFTFTFKEE